MVRSLLSYNRSMNIKAILATLPYRAKEQLETEIFRDYMSTGINMISETLANYFGGRKLSVDYYELIRDGGKQDNRSGDEIAGDVINHICGKE